MNTNSGVAQQISQGIGALASVPGMIAVVLLLVIFYLVVTRKSFRFLAIGFMLWVSSLSYPVGTSEEFVNRLIFPAQQLRDVRSPVLAAFLMMLCIAAAIGEFGWRRLDFYLPALAMIFYEFVFSTRLAFGGLFIRGAAGAVLLSMTFFVFSRGLGKWLQDFRDCRSLLRAIAIAGAFFILTNTIQVSYDPGDLVGSGRFYGSTGNAQHAAVLLSLVVPVCCWFVVRKDELKLSRIFFGVVSGFGAALLVWTGSRTGALMCAIGLLVTFRLQLRTILVIAVVGGLSLMLAWQVLGTDSTNSADRLLSTLDTRTGVWRANWETFTDHPLIGVAGTEAYGVAENSYLGTASNFGLVGLIPMMTAVGLIIANMVKLHRARKKMGVDAMFANLTNAGLAALLVGACFEAFLVATDNFSLYCVYIYLAIMSFLIEAARRPMTLDEEAVDWTALEAQYEASSQF